MRNENDRLMGEVEKLKNQLREQITRTQAGVRLDLNLEKGRIRDEASVHELKIKEVSITLGSQKVQGKVGERIAAHSQVTLVD